MSIRKIDTRDSSYEEFFVGRVLWVTHYDGYANLGDDGYPVMSGHVLAYDHDPLDVYKLQMNFKLVAMMQCVVWTGCTEDVPYTQQFVTLEIPVQTGPNIVWSAVADASLDANPDPIMFVNFLAWSSAHATAKKEFEGRRGLDLLLEASQQITHQTIEEYIDKWG